MQITTEVYLANGKYKEYKALTLSILGEEFSIPLEELAETLNPYLQNTEALDDSIQ